MRIYTRSISGFFAIGLVLTGCAARGSVRPGAADQTPGRVAPQGADTLLLRAVWSPDPTTPADADLTYWVTWVRNGAEVRSDTIAGLGDQAWIRRMGSAVPDTVLVSLWTLNRGSLSRRAHWQERIYRSSGTIVDTIDLGPAPPPDLSVPRPTAAPDAAGAPALAPGPEPAPAAPVAAAPGVAPAKPGEIRRVVLRIMDPPPAWRANGWDADCVAGVRAEGPLTLVVLPETPEHCRPYVESHGATAR
jgi:hypothetical protein